MGDSPVTETTVVWGAKAIGEIIGRNERQTHYLLEIGAIRAAHKAGAKKRSQWCASVAGLREQFFGEPAAAEHDNAAA
jgi:hypothetical protein